MLDPQFTTKSARGRKARAKGVSYERDVARDLKTIYPKAARQFGQSRDGHEAPDVSGAPFWVETSDSPAVSVFAKVEQALAASATCPNEQWRNLPVLVFVKRGKRELVAMERAQFVDWLRELVYILRSVS